MSPYLRFQVYALLPQIIQRITEKIRDVRLCFNMFLVVLFCFFSIILSNIIFSYVKLNSAAPILRLAVSASGHLKCFRDSCANIKTNYYVNYCKPIFRSYLPTGF